jgi:hypothetical protein
MVNDVLRKTPHVSISKAIDLAMAMPVVGMHGLITRRSECPVSRESQKALTTSF